MTEDDVDSVRERLNQYAVRFRLSPMFTNKTTRHWLLPRDGLTSTFLARNGDGRVTDLSSFYKSLLVRRKDPWARTVTVAQAICQIAGSVSPAGLLGASFALARSEGADLFRLFGVGALEPVLPTTILLPETGLLHHFVFNWSAPPLHPSQIGLTLPL